MSTSRKGIKLGRRTLNKSAMIREIAQRMVEEGKPPRPVEIVDQMVAEGVNITSGQVSLVLRGTSLALKKHVKPKARAAFEIPDLDAAMDQVALPDLIAAQELVGKLGSIEKAAAALVALSRLGGKAQKEDLDHQNGTPDEKPEER